MKSIPRAERKEEVVLLITRFIRQLACAHTGLIAHRRTHGVGGTALRTRSAERADKTMGYTMVNDSLTNTLKRIRQGGQVDWGVCGLQGPVGMG